MSTFESTKYKNQLVTEPSSIRYLKSCLEGTSTINLDSNLEQYLIEYGLVTTSKQITSKGIVLLEAYPSKSMIVLLLSEDSFPWLKADQGYVRFEGGKIHLVTDNTEKTNHAEFLVDLGIAKKDDSTGYLIIDRYTMTFLKRYEQTYLQNDMLYEEGKVGPNTSITVEKGGTLNLTQVQGDLQGNVSQTGAITNSKVEISQET